MKKALKSTSLVSLKPKDDDVLRSKRLLLTADPCGGGTERYTLPGAAESHFFRQRNLKRHETNCNNIYRHCDMTVIPSPGTGQLQDIYILYYQIDNIIKYCTHVWSTVWYWLRSDDRNDALCTAWVPEGPVCSQCPRKVNAWSLSLSTVEGATKRSKSLSHWLKHMLQLSNKKTLFFKVSRHCCKSTFIFIDKMLKFLMR